MISCQVLENKVKAAFAPCSNARPEGNIVFYPYRKEKWISDGVPKRGLSQVERSQARRIREAYIF